MTTKMAKLEQNGVTLLMKLPGGKRSPAAAALEKVLLGQMDLERQRT